MVERMTTAVLTDRQYRAVVTHVPLRSRSGLPALTMVRPWTPTLTGVHP